jgi:signal transduction histidine kinase
MNDLLAKLLRPLAHNVRSPLNSIIATSDLLLEGAYDELTTKQQRAVHRVRRNGDRLLLLIEDTVLYMKSELHELNLMASAFSPCSTILNTVEVLTPYADKKDMTFQHHLAESIPPTLKGDDPCIHRILLAVFYNAILYSDGPTVTIESDYDDGIWRIWVKDCGPVIAEPEKIFEPFWRGSSVAVEGLSSGYGLGLSLAHSLARLMRGGVYLEETDNTGNRFYIELKLQG